LVTEGGDANYRIEIIESSVSSFKARAVSVVDFDQDGTMDTWEIDHQGNVNNTVPD
jgi:type IV pilus assembly protein PilE